MVRDYPLTCGLMVTSRDDALIARTIAAEAARVLLRLRANVDESHDTTAMFDAAALRAAGDAAAQKVISAALGEAFPADSVLSEEAADNLERLNAERVWIIDPLDGTREFAERRDDGKWRDDFAVHVALWTRSHGLALGVVGLPGRGVVHGSDVPPPLPPSPHATLRIAVSRTRPPEFIAALKASGDAELVPMGSAGVKVLAVVSGEVDAYIHAGGQYQWDSAAPVAVAVASGCIATRLDGSPLRYNERDLRLPDLVVCHPDRADEVRRLLAASGY